MSNQIRYTDEPMELKLVHESVAFFNKKKKASHAISKNDPTTSG
jgi:hypothetical protein